ncbi:hypothetical protein [Sphingomonas alpina]|uniref:Uncharacterized protein n=1 Tax=Sphingomonas alpina TaxID=653931 RepID=A0A7H0LPZ9_9SPHN|nr:hypothetical protein [Sphingomonas alpina]QNQ11752.1 hypothetical protein H3Z74_11795 [Sphingomonas alpina]
MADISVIFALTLAAISVSLLVIKRASLQTARYFAYSAMTIFGMHAIGVQIVAPISSATVEKCEIAGGIWLIAGVAIVMVRGLRRALAGGQLEAISR